MFLKMEREGRVCNKSRQLELATLINVTGLQAGLNFPELLIVLFNPLSFLDISIQQDIPVKVITANLPQTYWKMIGTQCFRVTTRKLKTTVHSDPTFTHSPVFLFIFSAFGFLAFSVPHLAISIWFQTLHPHCSSPSCTCPHKSFSFPSAQPLPTTTSAAQGRHAACFC